MAKTIKYASATEVTPSDTASTYVHQENAYDGLHIGSDGSDGTVTVVMVSGDLFNLGTIPGPDIVDGISFIGIRSTGTTATHTLTALRE